MRMDEDLIKAARYFHAPSRSRGDLRNDEEFQKRVKKGFKIFDKYGFEKIGSGSWRTVFGNSEKNLVIKVSKDQQSLEENRKALSVWEKLEKLFKSDRKYEKYFAGVVDGDTKDFIWIMQEMVLDGSPSGREVKKLENLLKGLEIKSGKGKANGWETGDLGVREDGTPVIRDLA